METAWQKLKQMLIDEGYDLETGAFSQVVKEIELSSIGGEEGGEIKYKGVWTPQYMAERISGNEQSIMNVAKALESWAADIVEVNFPKIKSGEEKTLDEELKERLYDLAQTFVPVEVQDDLVRDIFKVLKLSPPIKEQPITEAEIEKMADEYCKEFLPGVDTTGHWLGFIRGYTDATRVAVTPNRESGEPNTEEDLGKR